MIWSKKRVNRATEGKEVHSCRLPEHKTTGGRGEEDRRGGKRGVVNGAKKGSSQAQRLLTEDKSRLSGTREKNERIENPRSLQAFQLALLTG